MLVKLAALGALGYAGYRYLQKQDGQGSNTGRVALAGGPLSDQARIQSDAGVAPDVGYTAGDTLRTTP